MQTKNNARQQVEGSQYNWKLICGIVLLLVALVFIIYPFCVQPKKKDDKKQPVVTHQKYTLKPSRNKSNNKVQEYVLEIESSRSDEDEDPKKRLLDRSWHNGRL
ncbi:MAG: hypothetical protein EOO20_03670 [Chryseobacterium sp.]|nr:MAG: hypothetical protein EOO20_03670 [Chryseobacterium sp.]